MNKKYLYIIPVILLIIVIYMFNNYKEYSRDYFYMDTYINVKVFSNSKTKAENALNEVDNIYKTYHNLTDRYNSHDNGLYNLNKDNSPIDNRLYDMIKYADSWYSKTNGLLDISIGKVIDIWKKYRESSTGVPTLKELKSVNINHNDIVIEENNEYSSKYQKTEMVNVTDKIKLKNNVSIDLGAISKGYTTGLVGDYLKSVGLNKFIINAGGNVLVGDKHTAKTYKIGIENPNDSSKVFKVIKGENISVVTSGGYQRNYTYNGITYNHIINPNTLFPSNTCKSVTVIDKNSGEADALSTTLFLMTIDEGKEFIKNYDAEAIWFDNNDNIITTDGISRYE